MFKLFQSKGKKENKTIEVFSPATGRMIDLNQVPDQVFASKMMGEGVAFELTSDELCAPIDGKITVVPETKHAFGIIADNGLELLVHIGLDTVNLGGEGFTTLVSEGDKVTVGMPIIKVNRVELLKKGVILSTPMVVTNSSEFEIVVENAEEVETGKTKVLTCSKK